MLTHFQRQGFTARIIDGSGCLKKIKADADSDLRITILGKERKVENKKRTEFKKIRSLVGDHILYIAGFCYVMNEFTFYELAHGLKYEEETVRFGLNISPTMRSKNKIYSVKEVADRRFGALHKFFDQDNADIVSLDESYKDFLICVQPALIKELENA